MLLSFLKSVLVSVLYVSVCYDVVCVYVRVVNE